MEQSVALNYVGFIFSKGEKTYFSLVEASGAASYRKELEQKVFIISETSSIKNEEISEFLKREAIYREQQYRN